MNLVLDPSRSQVLIHTFAEGLLARLAHDLEIVCTAMSGTGSRDIGEQRGTAHLEVPLAAVEVAGVLKDGQVAPQVLSRSEKDSVLAKMRSDVFHAQANDVVRIDATYDGERALLQISTPRGRALAVTTLPAVQDESDGVRVFGAFDVSLAALGSDVVKGPMNAFRVKDRIEVRYELAFKTR